MFFFLGLLQAFVPSEGAGSFSRLPQRETWSELKVREADIDRAVEILKQAGHQ